jgi:stalled ribosome rescue protein Dom34
VAITHILLILLFLPNPSNTHNVYKRCSTKTPIRKMTIDREEVESLLKKFPFYGRDKSRQEKVLSSYVVIAPGYNKSKTAEKLDVTRQTVQKIEEAWKELSDGQRLALMEYLRDQYENHYHIDEGEVPA